MQKYIYKIKRNGKVCRRITTDISKAMSEGDGGNIRQLNADQYAHAEELSARHRNRA